MGAYTAVLILCFSLYLFVQNQHNTKANEEIRVTIAAFYHAVDEGDFNAARALLSKSEDNNTYLWNIRNKMEAIKATKIKAHKIFPALINNDIALCAFSVDTENWFNPDNPILFREFAMRFFIFENGAWKFAASSDLLKYKESDIDAMITKYRSILKDGEELELFEIQKGAKK